MPTASTRDVVGTLIFLFGQFEFLVRSGNSSGENFNALSLSEGAVVLRTGQLTPKCEGSPHLIQVRC